MANLNFSTAQRDNFAKMLGSIVRNHTKLAAVKAWAAEMRVRVEECEPDTNVLQDWNITEATLYTDTDSQGFVYWQIEEYGSNHTINFYRDAARTELVAVAFDVENDSIGIIEPEDGFTLSGTVQLNTGSEIFGHIRLAFDARKEWETQFFGASSDLLVKDLKDAVSRDWDLAPRGQILSALTSMDNTVRTQFWLSFLARLLGEAQGEARFGIVTATHGSDETGRFVESVRGMIDALDDMFADNTTPITVQRNVSTLGAAEADADNEGVILFSDVQLYEHALDGTVVVRCESEEIGAEEFSIRNELDRPLRDGVTRTIVGGANAVINQKWAEYRMGIQNIKIERDDPVVTGGGGAGALVFPSVTVTGENPSSVDSAGRFYFKVDRLGSDWTIGAYRNQNLDPSEQIGNDVNTSGTSGTVELTIAGFGMTVTFDFDRAEANTAQPGDGTLATVIVDLKVSRIGDEYRLRLSNDKAGRLQTYLAVTYQASLERSGSASPNVNDGFFSSPNLVVENP